MQFKVGDIVEGKITTITSFGVFADIGDGKSGMVHISEVARNYVSDIKEHVKVDDVVKMKILNIGDDGKISLSIKRALPPEKKDDAPRREKRNAPPKQTIDSTYTWTPKKSEPASFEEMMNRFKQSSDEKFSDLKRKNPDANRTKRGNGVR
ncbi:MAG: S1 RNA-binding domain-containing protein [Clostridia bacterium]|nr:S1 RNA-binding domain-containing protein [Clostridia bacterium]